MEIITLTLFCLLLLLSVILKFSVILALLGGLCIFSAYGSVPDTVPAPC